MQQWVFGGPWTYDKVPDGGATGEDQAWLDEAMAGIGAVVGGRWTYEAADHWGHANPWQLPFFIVTHRPEEQPDGDDFTFVASLSEGIEKAAADVHIIGAYGSWSDLWLDDQAEL